MQYLVNYIVAGIIWTGFLEYYTTTKVEGPAGEPWVLLERILHILFWPVGFLIFTYNFIKSLSDGE